MKYTSLKLDTSLFLLEKANEIHNELSAFLSDLSISTASIIKVDCYLPMTNKDEYTACHSAFESTMAQLFGSSKPANTLINQETVGAGNQAIFRIGLIDPKKARVTHKQFQKHAYTLVEINDEKVLLSGNIHFDTSDELRNIQLAYDFAEQLLDHEEMNLGHMALLSDYIKQAEKSRTDDESTNMAEEVRTLYFDPVLFKHGYPLQLKNNSRQSGYTIDFIAASKDGFPTAQYAFQNNEDKHSTVGCYLPALQKIFIGNIPLSSGTEVQNKTQEVVNGIADILKNYSKTTNVIDEIKVRVADAAQVRAIEDQFTKQLPPHKLTVLKPTAQQSADSFIAEVIVTSTL
ncbi:hypothetical protein [Carboxylicivirga taeanensis]|uniref:hypothetical protein n=1 Tax=Carboxylicivirga taeanensis TaxID=1416875 RepID=UPI003F6DA5AE